MPHPTRPSGHSTRAVRDVEDRRLLVRFRRHGDEAAREELARRWLEITPSLVRRYAPRESSLEEELLGAAGVGIAKAIDRFELSRSTTFASYVVPTLLGEVRRHLRDHSCALRVARPIAHLSAELRRVLPRLTQELERSPSMDELAAALDCTVEAVLEAIDAETARSPASLQGRVGPRSEDGWSLEEVVGDADPDFARVDDALTLDGALRNLIKRDRMIVRLRFHDDLTQSEIAARVGISQMQVSRVLRHSLACLRRYLDGPDAQDDRAHASGRGAALPA